MLPEGLFFHCSLKLLLCLLLSSDLK
uniref:Uncharacterized protein n=1 Tax=Rhizophora mucronata TaxID=61149 RepID=A0A2P2PBY0_RHIMU